MTYVVEDIAGQVFFVTNLFDEWGREIKSPESAVTFVVKISDDVWVSSEIGYTIIHTVH